ncbi:MAG TPA: phosphomannomutase/phosphoglucomutase, partial [Clostridia bacterium]|nr:phosphomannomutase/phosphoglucomutase [Clostridia bacterium]
VDFVRRKTQKQKPFEGLHVIVDAGNGMGGFFVEKVLSPLGAETSGSQYLEPDGSFPHHIPNPEDYECMEALRTAVIKSKADLGICFDTDMDRAGAVDRTGDELNRNRLIALISAILLEERPGAVIVTDSVTSTGLADFIASRSGRQHRFKRGYRNVINEAIRLNNEGVDCPLAIETSGHAAFRENRFLDDGSYLMIRILIKYAQLKNAGKTLESLIAGLLEPAESEEFRLKVLAEDYKSYGNRLIAELGEYAGKHGWAIDKNNFEGIRVNFPPDNAVGWFLLRLSLHDPIIVINIESDKAGGVKTIIGQLLPFLNRYEALDKNPVTGYTIEA